MKAIFPRLLLTGFALASVSLARAAFSPNIVAADARWVVYADMNALRESAVGKEALNAVHMEQFKGSGGSVGIDFQKVMATVGTITAYGTNLSPDPKLIDGTLVAQGTPELRKIAESLLLQATIAEPKNFVEVTDLPFPAYAIQGGPKKDAPETQLIIAFPPEPIVLVSKSKAQLLKAREVFKGSAPSLAKTASAPLAKLYGNSKNSFLFAASLVPSEKIFPDNAPTARILQMASSGSLAVGENGADTFAHAELQASSPAMAEKLRKILEGMTAMISLTESSDKQLTDFLNATNVAKNGDVVTLDLSFPSARLATMVQTLNHLQNPEVGRPGPGSPRQIPIVSGKVVAEWTAVAAADPASGPAPMASRTVEGVELKNGSTITLGRQTNGGRNVRFDQCEIVPAQGGAPLVFRPEFMKVAGARGNMIQFQFPGADGAYTLKVAYLNDPDGKAAYAVSVREPAPRPGASSAVEVKSK